jgi:hypothetical protein
MENATQFSPPDTHVEIVGHKTRDGNYVLSVSDQGIGMSAEQLAEANRLMANPPVVGLALSRSLGFIVIGRLAARFGVVVRLTSSPSGGVSALVSLPSSVIDVQAPAEPASRGTTAIAETAPAELVAALTVIDEPTAEDAAATEEVVVEEAVAESTEVDDGDAPDDVDTLVDESATESDEDDGAEDAEPFPFLDPAPASTAVDELPSLDTPAAASDAEPSDELTGAELGLTPIVDTPPSAPVAPPAPAAPAPVASSALPPPTAPLAPPPAPPAPRTPLAPVMAPPPPPPTPTAPAPAAMPTMPPPLPTRRTQPVAPDSPGGAESPLTAGGLTRRVPKATMSSTPLMPSAPVAAPQRTPEEVRQMLSRYRSGLRRGRSDDEHTDAPDGRGDA